MLFIDDEIKKVSALSQIILSMEFDKNISDWSHDGTDHNNGIDFFNKTCQMAKNSCQKKPEILGTKVVQFWCYTKLTKTKNVLLHWYYLTKKNIQMIFDVENWLWKSDFGTFWPLFLVI
jgi:hypothetical protein